MLIPLITYILSFWTSGSDNFLAKKEIKMSRESIDSTDSSVNERSSQKRKEILRDIITKAESLSDTLNDSAIETLDMCMEQTDIINLETTIEEKMRNQEQVLLDSEMMSISSRVLQQCTRALTNHMSTYNCEEFARKVLQHLERELNIESEVVDWSYLENRAMKSIKTTPQYSTLLGTLVPLERKEIIKRKKTAPRDAWAQIRKPENLIVVDKEEEGLERTVKMKVFITRQYKTNHEPLNFFKLVLHPTSFGKTIENILQISFLVRDGKIQVTKDSSGTLIVQPCTKDTIRTTSGQSSNIQNVVYLNMNQWRVLRDIYRIEKPMINF
ncbi:SMC5-SMC6 complex kleisin component Non-SMC element 1 isoform X2 [Augochlora pura]